MKIKVIKGELDKDLEDHNKKVNRFMEDVKVTSIENTLFQGLALKTKYFPPSIITVITYEEKLTNVDDPNYFPQDYKSL